jgi:predicted pyridoxine 5'-phosphate oxidase superfamily flavin-nucleotide-binding protein
VKTTGEHAGEERTFHTGEAACQAEVSVAERMERLGPQVIRGYMPEQHRDFFPLLPFIVTGSIDRYGQPSASLLAAPPGFVFSPDPSTLRVDARPTTGDPLHENLAVGAPLGLLGIQAHTRRRNRLNGRVLSQDELGFTLRVEQSFGNCPKYITPREAVYVGSAARGVALVSDRLDERTRALVARADTFYLASAHPAARFSRAPSEGVDVSHRGGPPGFAHFIDDQSFVIPDFHGNNFFNTLGNLRLEPRAGLVFVDFVRGDVLALEAEARAHAGRHPLDGDAATGRVVRFEITRTRFHASASPLRFRTTPL